MLELVESPFAGVPIDAGVQSATLELLSATGDGHTAVVYVPPLLRDHALSAHADLEIVFSRWPEATRWRVEFLGEDALPSAIAVGVFSYLRDLVCSGVEMMLVGVPESSLADLSAMFTGLRRTDDGVVVSDEEEQVFSMLWAAA